MWQSLLQRLRQEAQLFLDLVRAGRLDFRAPDYDKFRCLVLAQAAAQAGGLQPATLNAANEVAVQAFLDRQLNFIGIAAVIEAVVTKSTSGRIGGLDDVLAADTEARQLAREQLSASQGGTRMGHSGVVRDAHA